MKVGSNDRRPRTSWKAALIWPLLLAAAACSAATGTGMQPIGTSAGGADPRVGLRGGWTDAGEAAGNLELIAHTPRPEGFFQPGNPGAGGFSNTDLAFSGNYAFLGNYNGFQIYDISNPSRPTLRKSVVCPGGQGDLSVYRNLLFMSVEETRGRLDCGAQGVQDTVSTERFRGVRIFDISNLDQPRQVATIQTCRGSHTHTLVTNPGDTENVYV
ncbi:MAG TPA: hypothetical protein VGR27_06000, partial [Longimicrobiaceae bacterium]|nr:hypothetical protein [Longimicrobiaceae bacterium]